MEQANTDLLFQLVSSVIDSQVWTSLEMCSNSFIDSRGLLLKASI